MEMKMVNVQTRRLELTLMRDERKYNIFPNYALDTHLLRIRILRQGSLWLFGEACSCPLLSYNCVSIYNLLYDNRCVQNLKVESVDLALELVPLASSGVYGDSQEYISDPRGTCQSKADSNYC